MAYSSKINLGGLSETPKTTDSEIFADLVDIYNAIHILSQYTDRLITEKSTEDSSVPPYEMLPPDRITWLKSAVDGIKAGHVVSYYSLVNVQGMGTISGLVLGVGTTAHPRRVFQETWNTHRRWLDVRGYGPLPSGHNIITGRQVNLAARRYLNYLPPAPTFIALTDGDAGDMVKVAVWENFLKMEGASPDTSYGAYPAIGQVQVRGGNVNGQPKYNVTLTGMGGLIAVKHSDLDNFNRVVPDTCVGVYVGPDTIQLVLQPFDTGVYTTMGPSPFNDWNSGNGN